MGEVLDNPIAQLMAVEKHQSPELLMHDSVSAVKVIGLKEARALSQFVPVLVLMAAGTGDKAAAVSSNEARDALGKGPGAAKLLEVLGKAAPKIRTKRSESGLAFGGVRVNFIFMEASRQGQPVSLTGLEFKTLQYMAQNQRRVITRDELLNKVWGYEHYPCTRTVDNLIMRLRQKLESEPSRPVHFLTVHGVGYKFSAT